MITTENCIVCGKKAHQFTGHVITIEKNDIGDFVPEKIIAGFCSDEHRDLLYNDKNGCFGEYNKYIMGDKKTT